MASDDSQQIENIECVPELVVIKVEREDDFNGSEGCSRSGNSDSDKLYRDSASENSDGESSDVVLGIKSDLFAVSSPDAEKRTEESSSNCKRAEYNASIKQENSESRRDFLPLDICLKTYKPSEDTSNTFSVEDSSGQIQVKTENDMSNSDLISWNVYVGVYNSSNTSDEAENLKQNTPSGPNESKCTKEKGFVENFSGAGEVKSGKDINESESISLNMYIEGCSSRSISNEAENSTQNTLSGPKQSKHIKEKRYKCHLCDKKFLNYSHVKNHARSHTGEKPYQCEICLKKFAQTSHLKQHIRIHSQEKLFACEICNSKFTENGTLKQHMRIHSGEKPYECKMCGYKCTQKGNLRRHIRLHSGDKPIKCEQCEYKCIQRSDLKKHVMKKHPEKKVSSANQAGNKCYTKETFNITLKDIL